MQIKNFNRCMLLSLFLFLFMFFGIRTSYALSDPYLSWDVNPDADYYEVYIKTPDTPYVLFYHADGQLNNTVNLATTKLNNEYLKQNVSYTFTVKAFNQYGNSSDFADPVTYTVEVPVKVSNLTVVKSTLTWNVVPTAIQYKLVFEPVDTSGMASSFEVTTNASSYDINTDTNILVNVPYSITVSAMNDTGVWGAVSNSVAYTRRLVRNCTNVKITKLPK